MDLRRLRVGEWVTGVSGVVLLVALFLPWYGDSSAWEALAVTDVVLALVALWGVALVPATTTQKTVAVPLALNSMLAPASVVALLLVLFRLIDVPGEGSRGAGVWLGALAMAALSAGTFVALRDERLSRPGKPTDVTGRPAPPRHIDKLPPPNPAA